MTKPNKASQRRPPVTPGHSGTTDVDGVHTRLRNEIQQRRARDGSLESLHVAWDMMSDADVDGTEVAAQASGTTPFVGNGYHRGEAGDAGFQLRRARAFG